MNQISNTAIPLNDNYTFSNTKQVNLTNEMFDTWRSFIYSNCGIFFQDNKKYLLESRLLKRIQYLGIESYEKYLEFVKFNSNGKSELRFLYDTITINETFFFRNQPQLDALVVNILPEVIALKQRSGKNKVRIWSSASSSGEEAFSAAISILDLVKPKYPFIEFEIVGTDLSTSVIEHAKKGIYKEYAIRNTSSYYLKKYFKKTEAGYELVPSLKEMVSFKTLNLYDELSMRTMTNFDVIFCANVLIYFDVNSKIKVVSNLYNSLNKGGYLFIGYSETLQNISKAFRLISFPKTIGYKKE